MSKWKIVTIFFISLLFVNLGLPNQNVIAIKSNSTPPSPPCRLYGTVKIDGEYVSPSTTLKVIIPTTGYSITTTITTYNGMSVYDIEIPADDPDTSTVEGGRDGDILIFMIDDLIGYPTAVWKSGAVYDWFNIDFKILRKNATINLFLDRESFVYGEEIPIIGNVTARDDKTPIDNMSVVIKMVDTLMYTVYFENVTLTNSSGIFEQVIKAPTLDQYIRKYKISVFIASNSTISISKYIYVYPPTCAILSPSQYDTVKGSVNITVTTNAMDLRVMKLFIDENVAAEWYEPGTYTYSWNTLEYTDGLHTIKLEVNTSSDVLTSTVDVYVDNSPPIIENITYYKYVLEGSEQRITASVYDTVSDISSIKVFYKIHFPNCTETEWYSINMEPMDGTKYLATISDVIPANSSVYFYIYANDSMENERIDNNMGRYYVYQILEKVNASCKILNPQNNSFVRKIVNIIVVANVSSSILDNITLSINETQKVVWDIPGIYEYDWNTETWDDGPVNITLTVTLNNGTILSDNIKVIIDNTPPKITSVEVPTSVHVNEVIRVNITLEDETSGIKEVFVVYSENKADWNNVTASLSDSKYVAYIPEQSRETTLYVYILAVDNSGNVKYDDNNGEYYVTYVILPNVTCKIISPENNSIVRDTVSIVVTLRALAIKNASLLIENEIAMAWFYSGNYSYSWNTTGLSDGRYKIELVLYTIDGEVYSDTITLLIDRHPPMLEDLTYPAEVNVGDSIIINITARDEISGIKGIYVLYTINDGIWINVTATKMNSKYNVTIAASAEGTLKFYIIMRDNADNMIIYDNYGEYYEVSIIKAVAEEKIICKILTPENESFVSGLVNITVSLSAPDFESGALYINDDLVSTWNSAGNHSYLWNTSSVSDGIYRITAILYITNGSSYSDEIIVFLDRQAPVLIDLEYPDVVEEGDKINITISAQDNLAGIKSVIVSYSINNGTWVNITATKINSEYNVTISATTNGTLRFYVTLIDNAGNKVVYDNDGAYYEITIKSKTEVPSEEVPTESEGIIGGIPTRTLIIIVGVAAVVVIIIFIVLKRR